MTVGDSTRRRSGIAVTVRSVLLGAALVIVATLASLFVLEGAASLGLVALDVLTTRTPALRPNTRSDSLLAWAGKPAYHNANAFGAGVGLSTDDAGRRITPSAGLAPGSGPAELVCSGDSYVLGLGVDDEHPWCAVLERYFTGLRTLNMGQLDYGVDQSFLWYRRDGASISPRAHVFAVTATALERAASDVYLGRNKPYLTVENDRVTVGNLPLAHQSAWELRRAAMRRALDELQIMRLVRRRPAFDRAKLTSAQVDERWPVLERMLDELAALDKSRGVTLVLAYLPSSRDRRPSHLDVWRDTLAAYAARGHVPLVDLTRDLRALRPDSADIAFISSPAGGPVQFGGQYSNVGHAWVARTLASRLPAVMDAPRLLGASSTAR
jgi:hypothetical protein